MAEIGDAREAVISFLCRLRMNGGMERDMSLSSLSAAFVGKYDYVREVWHCGVDINECEMYCV